MKAKYSLWLIILLLWGISLYVVAPRQTKTEKTSAINTQTAASAAVPEAHSLAAALSAKTSFLTGTVTSITFGQQYTAADISQAVTQFFGSYTYAGSRFAVQAFSITFTSKDYDGTPVAIHAQVFVPSVKEPAQLPVYVFASGTTGIGDLCAPSLEQPTKRRWGWYRENMLAYASRGYLVIFPDYTGFNDASRPQRYFSKKAEGYMLLDAIRAMFNFFNQREVTELAVRPARAVFVGGYSQGGHAAFAAADLHAEYAPEVPLTGVITYGGTTDVEALLREGAAYGPLVLYYYMMMYGQGQVNPADFLLPQWLPTFESDASTMSVDVFQHHFGFDASRLYTPKFLTALKQGTLAATFPALSQLLADNRTGYGGHKLPALVIQGGDDFIVTTKTQTQFVTHLQELGSEVQYRILPHVTHRDTRAAGFAASVSWMQARLLELGLPLPIASN
jgi:pimeloyl-ACP methyl ester carboxylesterase